jgi:hypothetical protein
MSLKTTEFVTNNNMVVIPHPTYLQELVPCDFALFLKLKVETDRATFETVSDIQRESQVVLNSIKENDFHGAFEGWEKDGIAYMFPTRIFRRLWQPKLSKLSQHFLFDLVQELSDSTFSEQEW